MEQYFPALTMFAVTFVVTTLLFVPVTAFKSKRPLVRFYWNGFWGLLALIASFAGGMNTLMLMRVDVQLFSEALLAGTLVAYVLFVMFAWVRLVGTTAFRFVQPRLAAITNS